LADLTDTAEIIDTRNYRRFRASASVLNTGEMPSQTLARSQMHASEWRAKFVRDIGNKSPLCRHQQPDLCCHRIEVARQVAQLIVTIKF
jgi:hypothetical protein